MLLGCVYNAALFRSGGRLTPSCWHHALATMNWRGYIVHALA